MMEAGRGGLFFSSHADRNDSQFRQGQVGEWPHGEQAIPLLAKSKNRNPPPLFRKPPVPTVPTNGILLQKKFIPACFVRFN